MKTWCFLLTGVLVLAACSSKSDPRTGAGPVTPDAGEPPRCTLADGVYPAPSEWQRPTADYVAALEAHPDFEKKPFSRAIDDLAVFDDRLYLGYGDANYNAGRVTPIEIRAYRSPSDAAPQAEPIRMAGEDELQTHTREETVSQYRVFGDRVFVAGVDATEDAWLGNVFVRERGSEWVRHRTVTGGVHVHDVAVGFDGALYAVGSGASGKEAWDTGKVHSYLWRSTDSGLTWSAAADVENVEVGDRRWTHLVSFGGELQMFGYRTEADPSTGAHSIVEVLNHRWDGAALSKGNATPKHWVQATHPFAKDVAIVAGVKVGTPLKLEVLALRPGAAAQPIAALAGATLLDAFQVGDGSAVLMVADGDAYPRPEAPPRVRVLHTTDLETFRELFAWEPDAWPTSVAVWHDDVYVGLTDGRLLRSHAP